MGVCILGVKVGPSTLPLSLLDALACLFWFLKYSAQQLLSSCADAELVGVERA